MIQANELRIGNLFIDYETEPEKQIVWEVEEIRRSVKGGVIGVSYRNGSSWTAEPIPIPLTPEVLEACGFEIKMNGRYSSKWFGNLYITVITSLKDRIIDIRHVDNVGSYKVGCNSLHQLQNLIFALSGEELEIDFTKLVNAVK